MRDVGERGLALDKTLVSEWMNVSEQWMKQRDECKRVRSVISE